MNQYTTNAQLRSIFYDDPDTYDLARQRRNILRNRAARQRKAERMARRKPKVTPPISILAIHAAALGLSGQFNIEDVRAAYRQTMLRHHPDKHHGSPHHVRAKSEQLTKAANAAREYFERLNRE